MNETKIAAYREAVENLKAAIKELKAEAHDWNSAFERVQEAAKICQERRNALNDD